MHDDLPDIPPEEWPEVAAQVPVIARAWKFLEPLYIESDLVASWRVVDPELRLVWAQWWAHANEEPLTDHCYDPRQLSEEIATQGPDSRMWEHFEPVVLRDIRDACPLDPARWGIGSGARAIGLDTELLYVHKDRPVDGRWQPDVVSEVVPIVLRLRDGDWNVLNFGFEAMPSPGWPPRLD